MQITSTAFEAGKSIPSKYTCDGENTNPSLAILEAPENAKSLVLILDDPDSPTGTWIHWLMWNIDPSTGIIAENSVPEGAVQGTTSFGKAEYGGPCPHSGQHRYFFKIFALDIMLDLDASTDISALEEAMQGHILDQAEIMGVYSR